MIRPLSLAALALMLPGLALAADEAAPATAPRPVVSEVVHPDAGLERAFTGTVVARTQIDLAFQTLGRIAERSVDVGDRVTAGQVLARLDPYTLDEDVAAAEAALVTAEAKRVTAQNALDRSRELRARGVDPVERLEAAERALAAAVAAVDSAAADLARARDARSYSDLKAPIDGVVVSTANDVGAVVPAGTPVLVVASTTDREALIDLPEGYLSVLRPGDAFEVTLRGAATAPVKASLRLVEPVIDPSSRTRRVHLALEDAPPAYRLGSLIRARALQPDRATLFTLPAGAIRADDGAPPQVWRVDPVSRAVALVEVTVEPRPLGDRVIVTAGLKDGDEIVTRGVHSLQGGQIVGAGEGQ